MTTNNRSMLEVLGIYDLKNGSAKGDYAARAGVVYFSNKGYLAVNRTAEDALYNKRIELPALCPLDGICKKTWRDQVLQAEANLSNGTTLDVILKEKTGSQKWEIGLGLSRFALELKAQKKGHRLFMGDICVAQTRDASVDTGVWYLNSFGINQSAVLVGHLIERAKLALELSCNEAVDFLPVHPGWIKCNADLRFNLLVTKRVNNKRFMDIVFDRMRLAEEKRAATLIRFGKDAVSAECSEFHTLSLAVYADKAHDGKADMLSDDGVIFVKSFPGLSTGEFGLIRGCFTASDGSIGIVKARLVVNPYIAMCNPEDDALHIDSIDGWSRLGQFKFAPVEPGTVLTVSVGLKKDESDEGEKDFFSINQAASYVARFDDRSTAKFNELLSEQVREEADGSLATNVDKDLAKIFEGSSCSANGDMAKYLLGMSSDWTDPVNDTWVRNRLKSAYSARSRDILRVGIVVTDSISYADIERDNTNGFVFKRVVRHVPVDAMLASEKLADRLERIGNTPITISRDPVLTATSYLAVGWNRKPIPGFTTRFAFISSVAGPDLGADCDDFIKILVGYKSLVKPGEIPAIEKHCDEIGLADLSNGSLYAWGMVAQGMVGAYVNCLHRSVLYGADPNEGEAMKIAQACQALVQAIKKPVVPSISFAAAKEIADVYEESYTGSDKDSKAAKWTIIHKSAAVEEKREAINEYFGKDYSFEERVVSPDVTVSAQARPVLGNLFVEFFKKGSRRPVATLNREVVDALLKIHAVDVATAGEFELRSVVQDYYAFFRNVWLLASGKKSVASPVESWKLGSAVKLAYGAALYWGATSYQSREDIFLQALRALEVKSFVAED